ncbi:hypothetical protein D3C75_950080 [compost metagenome]
MNFQRAVRFLQNAASQITQHCLQLLHLQLDADYTAGHTVEMQHQRFAAAARFSRSGFGDQFLSAELGDEIGDGGLVQPRHFGYPGPGYRRVLANRM